MRKSKTIPYTKLSDFPYGTDAAANLSVFLLETSGSIYGQWRGRLVAADQRRLFGRFLGKGRLTIDGTKETVAHYRTVCFGQDFDIEEFAWRELGA